MLTVGFTVAIPVVPAETAPGFQTHVLLLVWFVPTWPPNLIVGLEATTVPVKSLQEVVTPALCVFELNPGAKAATVLVPVTAFV